jgi:hypothetical protein
MNRAVSALFGGVKPRVVNQNLPHNLRNEIEKMLPVFPFNIVQFGQFEKCFVNERGRLQGVV